MDVRVLDEYCRICGIKPGANREATIKEIKSFLAKAEVPWDRFDDLLIQEENVPEGSMPARWLAGDRQPLSTRILGFSVKVKMVEHWVGNLTTDKGGASALVQNMVETEAPNVVAEKLRDRGYSLREVMSAFHQAGYVATFGLYGNEAARQALPAFLISKQPRTKSAYQFWKSETNDLTYGDPVVWELPFDKVKELHLPEMRVLLPDPDANVEIEELDMDEFGNPFDSKPEQND